LLRVRSPKFQNRQMHSSSLEWFWHVRGYQKERTSLEDLVQSHYDRDFQSCTIITMWSKEKIRLRFETLEKKKRSLWKGTIDCGLELDFPVLMLMQHSHSKWCYFCEEQKQF
jgi:hypothetical protein